MADVSAAMVKELREKTGAGMMDCKKALAETGGDFAKAEEWLRKKGITGAAKKSGQDIDTVRAAREKSIPAGRFGTPSEFGAICAFLCSVQAGYLTGQNVLADGGAYPGTY